MVLDTLKILNTMHFVTTNNSDQQYLRVHIYSSQNKTFGRYCAECPMALLWRENNYHYIV